MSAWRRGMTLLEATTALSVGAIVLIVAAPVFRREVRPSHQTEARDALLRIGEAAAAFARSPKHPRTFPSAIARTPSEVPRGTAVALPEEAWEPWSALGVQVVPLGFPQRYAYSFARPANDPLAFEAVAEGDLDGDGVLGRAVLRGSLDANGNVHLAPDVEFVDALE